MVAYSKELDRFMPAMFPPEEIVNTLGEWLATNGKRQFRLAETEKYPHVTYFLNGGVEDAGPGRGPLACRPRPRCAPTTCSPRCRRPR